MSNISIYSTACGYVQSSKSGLQFHVGALHQSRRINAYCASTRHILTRTVVEHPDGPDSRPELDRLLDEITSPGQRCRLLVVCSRSRLSRDMTKLRRIEARLAAAEIELVALDELPASASTPIAEAL